MISVKLVDFYELPKNVSIFVGDRGSPLKASSFQRDLKNPDYVKMDKSFIRSTFMGEFNPTRGDLVFSQTGELLGIMANSQYCHLIKSVDPVGAVVFGKNDYSKVAKTLRDMHKLVAAKPSELR